MSNNVNDSKILALKAQIQERKDKLIEIKKFNPVTNCSLELDGEKFNIRVLTKEQLVLLLVKLNIYKKSAEELKILEHLNISGYNIEDWITDIKIRFDIEVNKEEERKLKQMESKLNQLLSEEKKTELEIDEISKYLNL